MSKKINVQLSSTDKADFKDATMLLLYDCGNSGERYEQALELFDKDESAIADFVSFEMDDTLFEFYQLAGGGKINIYVSDSETGKKLHSSVYTDKLELTHSALKAHIDDLKYSDSFPPILKEHIQSAVEETKEDVKSGNAQLLRNRICDCATWYPLNRYRSEYPKVTDDNIYIGLIRHLHMRDSVDFEIELDDDEKFDKSKLILFSTALTSYPNNMFPKHDYYAASMVPVLLYDNTLYYGNLGDWEYEGEYYGILKFTQNMKDHSFSCVDAGFGKPVSDKKERFIPDLTKIDYSAYEGNLALTSFTVPSTVTVICASAFGSCENLTEIEIPDSVSRIESHAFNGCKSLLSIKLPNNIEKISAGTFKGCSALTSIELPNHTTKIEYDAFKGCQSLKSVSFPQSLTEISRSSFTDCTSLKSIVIPSEVTIIDDHAFSNCTGLETLDIHGPVEKIGEQAFFNCESLKSVTLPTGIKKIHKTAFDGCTSLETIKVPPKKSDYYKKRLPESLHSRIVELS